MSQPVLRSTLLVTDPAGVHARTAVAIAELARRHGATITLSKGGQQATATDVLQIMSLAVCEGETLEVEVSGNHATEVLETLAQFLAGKLDEETKPSA